MLKRGKSKPGLNALILSAALAVLPGVKAAVAQTLCAEVRLEIKQEAALEREAFDAALEVINQYPSYGLENFRVNVLIKDPRGKSADNLFFVKISSKEAINAVDGAGLVQPASTATVHWLIIPSTGAGGVNPLGLAYSVRADISYDLNGVHQAISTFEDSIVVKPQPALKLEYLLPFEIFADEPLTDVIEPVEPFPLGVRITNVGYGPARNFRINSGQPEIIENKQGLAIDFKLLGTYVGDKKIPDTLLIPFGEIPAGGVTQAAWIMAASLSGRFVKFDAAFTHAAELGGQLTSLVQDATTYTLVKDVLVDLPGRDNQFDFLVNTTTPRGTMENLLASGGQLQPEVILESDQAAPIQVVRLTSELSGELNGANTSATLRLTQSAGPDLWVFTSMPAPRDGRAKLVSAVRRDGKSINTKNVWLSRHFSKADGEYSYRLNLVDYNPPALAEYTLNFSRDSLDAAPAPITDLGAFAMPVGGRTGLNWSATGEDAGSGAILGGRYLIQAATSPASEFSPPLAQVNFTTNTAPGARQIYLMKDLAGNASCYLKLWIQDTGGNISAASNLAEAYVLPNPPSDLAVGAISSTAAAVSWNGGNNNPPVEYGVWADTDAVLPAAFAAPFKDPFDRAFVFEGLTANTTYFFYGIAKNPVNGVSSERVYLGLALTLAAAPGQVVSSQLFASSFTVAWDPGGNSGQTEYFVRLSTAPDWSVLAAESGWIGQPSYTFSGLTPDTTYYLRAKARNAAGIETGCADLGVLKTQAVDTLPPVTAAEAAGLAGSNGWYVSPVTLTLVSTDALSGVKTMWYRVEGPGYSNEETAYISSFTAAAEGLYTVRWHSVDNAGNIEPENSLAVKIDTTPPAILISSPAAGEKYAGADVIEIGFSISDNLSLVNSSAAYLRQTVDSGTPRGELPELIPVTAGQSVAAADIDDGVWELIASATDYAGNYFYASGGAFEVIHGTVPAVRLKLEPETLNLGSKGEAIIAKLKIAGGETVCFDRAGIKISAINGQELETPIYARKPGGDDSGKGRGGEDAQCGSITVKFDRAAVIAVLPINAAVSLTVSGELSDGSGFSAEDTIRTISPAADPEFRLGEVYVLPNPAMGGAKPVFHIETGVADSVKLTIRTVSGMVIHEHTLTGMPRTLNLGGNLVYSYEYAWEGKIPGGVYSYAIEAEKAGQTLQKSGMFAVMR